MTRTRRMRHCSGNRTRDIERQLQARIRLNARCRKPPDRCAGCIAETPYPTLTSGSPRELVERISRNTLSADAPLTQARKWTLVQSAAARPGGRRRPRGCGGDAEVQTLTRGCGHDTARHLTCRFFSRAARLDFAAAPLPRSCRSCSAACSAARRRCSSGASGVRLAVQGGGGSASRCRRCRSSASRPSRQVGGFEPQALFLSACSAAASASRAGVRARRLLGGAALLFFCSRSSSAVSRGRRGARRASTLALCGVSASRRRRSRANRWRRLPGASAAARAP